MKDRQVRKSWNNRGKINRATAILLALIGVMLVLIAIPGWKALKYLSQRLACEQAMKSAKDGLIIEYLNTWGEGSVEDARKTLDQVMVARPNICPAGGTVYLIKRPDGIFEPLCGMHDRDLKERAKLNANFARDALKEALRKARRLSDTEPESVEIEINGQTLECVRVPEVQNIHRGTSTTEGYEGIVALYGIAGDGSFSSGDVEEGEVCYFVYADEDYCGVWKADDGWTGSAFKD